MALRGVDVGVDPEGERLVDQQLVGVEVAHQVGEGVPLLLGHPGEVGEVLTELDLVREPGVGHGLVVQVVRPGVRDRLEQQALAGCRCPGCRSGASAGIEWVAGSSVAVMVVLRRVRGGGVERVYWQDSHWSRSCGSIGQDAPSTISSSARLQPVDRGRRRLAAQREPSTAGRPERRGRRRGAGAEADAAGGVGAGRGSRIWSALLTLTVLCSAVCRGIMCR